MTKQARRKVFTGVIVQIFFTVITVAVVHGATITVKQLGGGDYITIGQAINHASQGDTIEIYAGFYEEPIVINQELTLKGMGPHLVTVIAPLQQNTITVQTPSPVSISGIKISSNTNGIVFVGANTKCEVRNCVIEGCGGAGIYLKNQDAFNLTVLNNTIVDNLSHGVYLEFTGMSNPASATIASNIIAYNKGYGVYDYARYGTISNFISYNDVYSNTAGNYYSVTAGPGDISQNPQFIDRESGNYVLSSALASPCIDSGQIGSVHNDPDNSRNDMGAYGGPGCAPFWPYPPGAPVITNLNAAPTSVPKGTAIVVNATGEVSQ